ncbi:hypothetical protein Q8F55_005486 [Vanrija albida]|uniref:Peptidase A1 domain-containing protein n=1 Tax=Vanrija albida TaxID=181172 RepID=A0ABR3Q1Z6_9TREE
MKLSVAFALLGLAATSSAWSPFDKRDNAGLAGPQSLDLTRDISREAELAKRSADGDDDIQLVALRAAVLNTRRKYIAHFDEWEQAQIKRDIDDFENQERGDVFKRQLDSGSSLLTGWGRDVSYSANVAIGTPPQYFDVHMDTGSSDLYVFDQRCAAPGCRNSPTKFFSQQSSTYRDPGIQPKNITFGIGYSAGPFGQDRVAMAGFYVQDQIFMRATDHDDGYLGTNTTGLMGLAWSTLSIAKITPWWQTLASGWRDKEFGFYLARVNPTTLAAATTDRYNSPAWIGGRVTFGGLDQTLYQGQVNYVPLLGQDYWRVPLDAFTVNGRPFVARATDSQNSAIIDTGSTLVIGPQAAVDKMYSAIQGARKMTGQYSGYWQYPCNALTSISFTFGGVEYPIYLGDMTRGSLSSQQGYCIGSIIGQQTRAGSPVQWIVGDVFMKNVYTSFRASPPSVGFARLASNLLPPGNKGQTALGPAPNSLGSNEQPINGASPASGGNSGVGSGSGSGSGSGRNGAGHLEVPITLALAAGGVLAALL